MLSDRARTSAYTRALKKVIRRGDTVLDVGCGTGILGLLALRAGAGRVIAVDRNPIIYVAEVLYRENGFADQVTFHHQDVRDLRIRKKVDVVISEILGNTAFDEGVLETLDTALLHLKRGGRVVPQSLDLYLAPVSAPQVFQRDVQLSEMRGMGFSTDTLQMLSPHHPVPCESFRTIAPEARVGRVDLGRRPLPQRPITFTAQFRPQGTMHGITLWFKTTLAPGVRLDSRKTISWVPLLFPITEPVRLRQETVHVDLTCHADNSYTWIVRTPGRLFSHNSRLGEETMVAQSRMSAHAVPQPTPDLLGRMTALRHMDGKRTFAEIARAIDHTGSVPMDLVKKTCLQMGIPWHDPQTR